MKIPMLFNQTFRPKIKTFGAGISVVAALSFFGSTAISAQDVANIDIASQTTANALLELAKETGVQIIVPDNLGQNTTSPTVVGSYSIDEVLARLLNGTGLKYSYAAENMVVVSEESDAKVTPKNTEQLNIEEIMVTATKRSTSLQDTAMSISAIGSEEMGRKGLVGMGDYLSSIPGITMAEFGAGRNAIVMRGVGVNPQNDVFNNGPTVGVYFGDMPLTTFSGGYSTDIKLVDMERIEILRGPQGTLYGSSSLGGTVRNIPAKPNTSEFDAGVSMHYSFTDESSTENTMLQGFFNLPLVENKLALRASAYRYRNGGYIDNVAGDDPVLTAIAAANGVPETAVNREDIAEELYTGDRISLRWEPTDKLSVELTHLEQKIDQDGHPEALLRLGTYQQSRFDLSDYMDGGERLADDIAITNVVFDYDLGWASLHSSTSWAESSSISNRDLRPAFPSGTLFASFGMPQAIKIDTDGFVEELRLASQLDGPIQFIAGIYYEDIDHIRDIDITYAGDALLNPLGTANLFEFDMNKGLKQTAYFGEVSYDYEELIKLTLGARIFNYDRSTFERRDGFFAGGALSTSAFGTKDNGKNFKVNLSYTPNDDTLLYAQWAEGFRLGQENLPVSVSLCDLNNDGFLDGSTLTAEDVRQLDPDTLETYEVGGKFTQMDGRLTVNTSVYQTNWNDMPQGFGLDCGFFINVNASRARIRGAEIETGYYLTEDLRLTAGASFTDAELVEDDLGTSGGQAGDRLPSSAKYNFNAGLDYNFEVAGRPSFIHTDYYYLGDFYNNFQETGIKMGDYHVVNMKAGIELGEVGFELFVNNLTNSTGIVWTDIGLVFDERVTRLRPRTVGLRMNWRY